MCVVKTSFWFEHIKQIVLLFILIIAPCDLLRYTSSTTFSYEPFLQPGRGVKVPTQTEAVVRCQNGYQLIRQQASVPRCDRGNWINLNGANEPYCEPGTDCLMFSQVLGGPIG